MLRHPRAVAVGSEARIAKPEGNLLALQETSHELIGLKLLSSRVPLVAIGDFDLAGPLALVEIRYRGAQRRAGPVRIEGLAGHPEASLVVFETGLEIGDEEIMQLIARLEEVRQMATPLKVGDALQAGWGP